MTTHRNHYVPEWYQKRFIKPSEQYLYYLNLSPDKVVLPKGGTFVHPPVKRYVPKQCFWALDLYTTMFMSIPNDEVERFLFGEIDDDGAKAIRAVVSGEMSALHESFQQFFEYIDAQKLRTPKGLDWVKSNYPELSQISLMREMQHLRRMHCTMWFESVREIVSAKDSDIKFIVSDHPVTIYHSELPPESRSCLYPNDPDIALIGSQTIFPLDYDHCLILTNLEYAQNPNRTDLKKMRQHARHFDNTIARVDAWIRKRLLSRDEVTAINSIVKARAKRFVAAAEEAWLYPELAENRDWRSLRTILLPPAKELFHFGGEIIIGYQDGTSHYQDAFGRTSRSHEYLRKKVEDKEPGALDACLCGSGRTYERCCKDIPVEDRMPSNVFSIRERNLMFCGAIDEILGIDKGKSWEDVRRELTDEQVKQIHEAYSSLWPTDTDIADLLPRPDARVIRGLYVGLIDPRTVLMSVIGWLRYFDEIVILNPFLNPTSVKAEFSPVKSPAQFKEQTLKNVMLLYTLMPFIRAGIVHLVPDPVQLNIAFRDALWTEIKRKSDNPELSETEMRIAEEFARSDLGRMLGRLPDPQLRKEILKSSPDLNESELAEVVAHIRAQHEDDPLALMQPLEPGKDNGQFSLFTGMNFELGVFLSQLTGAAIYTNQKWTKQELTRASIGNAASASQSAGAGHSFYVPLVIDLDAEKVFELREDTLSKAFRTTLRTLFEMRVAHAESGKNLENAVTEVELIGKTILDVARKDVGVASTHHRSNLSFNVELMMPTNGYSLDPIRRFLIGFGHRRYSQEVPMALYFDSAEPIVPLDTSG